MDNTLSLNGLNKLAVNDTNFYHIEGKVCYKWNDSIGKADEHIADKSIHLNQTDRSLLTDCQTHLNDINIETGKFKYHLSGSDRSFLTELQDTTGTKGNSIIKIQNDLANKIDSAFEIGNKEPTNQKKLWIDTDNKVLKYYNPTANKWVIVPVAYS